MKKKCNNNHNIIIIIVKYKQTNKHKSRNTKREIHINNHSCCSLFHAVNIFFRCNPEATISFNSSSAISPNNSPSTPFSTNASIYCLYLSPNEPTHSEHCFAVHFFFSIICGSSSFGCCSICCCCC